MAAVVHEFSDVKSLIEFLSTIDPAVGVVNRFDEALRVSKPDDSGEDIVFEPQEELPIRNEG